MESTPPHFWFDYIDPWSFIVECHLREAERVAGVEVVRRPLEIAPPPVPPLRNDEPAWIQRWDTATEEGDPLGLAFVQPEWVPWTRKAHELAMHARASMRFAEVHDALFRACLLDGRDIGRIDVLVEIAAGADLDRAETRLVLGVDRHLDDVRSIRDSAERAGVRGVPTLSLGGQRLEGLADVDEIVAFLSGL